MKSDISDVIEAFEAVSFESGSEFNEKRRELWLTILDRRERELQLVDGFKAVTYDGVCGICRREVNWTCEMDIYRTLPDGRVEPASRERLVCPCGLSNRLRASLHFMLDKASLDQGSRLYLTEQTTPFFELMKGYCPEVVGSEYLQDGTAPGSSNGNGIRHEDVTALTFDANVFDVVGSFEVLEHVPDYKAGLREMCRVLRPGGHLVASFPFRNDLLETLVRARIGADGKIEHILEPEYHGDPLNAQGVLCYYHFGWDILDAMREAGFKEARCHFYWGWESGYLGGALPLFHAVK